MNKGQPTPPVPCLINHKTKKQQYTRQFCISQYEKVGWLVGCKTTNFIVGPVYFFLTNTKYVISGASQI